MKINLITKIMKSVLVVIMTFVATFAFAADLHSPIGIPVLEVAHKGANWTKSINVHPGEEILFQVHYYANDGHIYNVRDRLEDLRNYTFVGTKRVTGSVSGNNVNTINDQVTLHSSTKVKLVYDRAALFLDGNSVPYWKINNAVIFPTYSAGDVADGHYGNLVAVFKVIQVQEEPKARVVTNSETNVTTSSVNLRGAVTSGNNVQAWFTYAANYTPSCNSGTRVNVSGNYNNGQGFAKTISGLSDNTTYYYRACGTGHGGQTSGTVKSFTTVQEEANAGVATYTPTNVTTHSANLRGAVTSGNNVQIWFTYSANSAPSCNSGTRVNVSGNYNNGQGFAKTISGLSDNTTYYYRACGTGHGGDTSGTVKSFTTTEEQHIQEVDVAVATENKTGVTTSSARLKGRVTAGNNARVWFVYSRTDSTPECNGNDTKVTVSGYYDAGQGFDKVISGLSDNTTYYYRACATGHGGDAIGAVKNLTTDQENTVDNDVNVYTKNESNVDKNSAKLNGVVTDGQNIKTWFVYSRTDSTPECNGNDTKVTVSGYYDENETFSKTIYNLDENTKYYYRACGSKNGNTNSGNVESLTTDKTVQPVAKQPSEVVTKDPTSVLQRSAHLNGYIDLKDDEYAYVYFKYGVYNLNENTVAPLKVTKSQSFQAIPTNLKPGVKYYYRAYVKDPNGNIRRGEAKSFRTKGAYVPYIPKPYRPPTDDTIKIVIEDKRPFQINKWVSKSKTSGYDTEINAEVGDTVYYKVRVTNNSSKVMKNISVTDSIPYLLELDTTSTTDDNATKYLTWKINSLQPGQTREFVTEMRISGNANNGDVIDSKAEITSSKGKEFTNNVRIYVGQEDEEPIISTQGASLFGANSDFFPKTLIGYVGLLAVVLLVVFLISLILGRGAGATAMLAKLKQGE